MRLDRASAHAKLLEHDPYAWKRPPRYRVDLRLQRPRPVVGPFPLAACGHIADAAALPSRTASTRQLSIRQRAAPRQMSRQRGYVLGADSAAPAHQAGTSFDEALCCAHKLLGLKVFPLRH